MHCEPIASSVPQGTREGAARRAGGAAGASAHKIPYAPAVRAQLHVQTSNPDQPAQAAQALAAELVRDFPRQRPVTLAILALGPHPGQTPTPWVLDGVLAALVEGERTPAQLLTLGDQETAQALLRKSGHDSGGARELVERPSRDRKLSVRVTPGREALTVARELVGSSLVVVAPLCWMAGANEGPDAMRGPLAQALGVLAEAHGARVRSPRGRSLSLPGIRSLSGLRGPNTSAEPGQRRAALVEQGLAWLRANFASASLLFDASWLALLERDTQASSMGRPALSLSAQAPAKPRLRPLAELESPARVMGLSGLERSELQTLRDCDDWLGRAIGLDRPEPARAPSFSQPPGSWPRPRLHAQATASKPKRMADRAIAGIRSQARGRRPRTQAALPPRVPGAFAQLWAQRWYGAETPHLEGLAGRSSARPVGLR